MIYCSRCGRYFGSMCAYEQHQRDSSSHNICSDCGEDFSTYDTLKKHRIEEHRRQSNHADVHSGDEGEPGVSEDEDGQDYCALCGVDFDSASELEEHNQQSHFYCPECHRHFASDSNLQHHFRSSLHVDATVPCPGGRCGRLFVSGAALVFHLESGACRSHVTRDKINRAAVKYDTGNIITNPARMLAYGENGEGFVVTWATELAWNGSAYECILCHRECRTLESLNQHLASPAHEEEMYRCPRAYSGCGAEFKALSALCQHVESERCEIRRFNAKVQDYLGDLTSNMKRLGI